MKDSVDNKHSVANSEDHVQTDGFIPPHFLALEAVADAHEILAKPVSSILDEDDSKVLANPDFQRYQALLKEVFDLDVQPEDIRRVLRVAKKHANDKTTVDLEKAFAEE